MLEEYKKIPLKAFMGLYARGTPEEVPKDHFVAAQNLAYKPGSFGIRPGSSLQLDFGTPINDITEWVPTNATPPYPVVSIDNSGNIRLWTATGVTNLYTVPGATNFSAVNFYGRLFITPYNSSGPVGNLLMLYMVNNVPTVRQCGCDIPITKTAMVATVNTAGGQSSNNTSGPTAVTQIGSLNPWGNLLNVLNQNSQYSTVTLYGSSNSVNTSNALQITGFDFSSIPDDANVLGIQVKVWHCQLGGSSAIYDSSITLLGVGSNNKASSSPWNNSSEEVFTYGSSTDLWGNTTLGGADINSQQFGLQIVVDCTLGPGGGAVAGIDYVQIQAWWQTSAGEIQTGTYAINLLYETDTGFYSPPATSPMLNIQATVSQNGCSITLTNIPVSPLSYVTARYIIVAQVDSLGDIGEYYFVPASDGGVLNDNVRTSTTLSFFITDLVESAENLFNIYARVPAGRGINLYAARLVMWGFTQPDASLLTLSDKADPETFDQTLMSIIVNKDDGYPVTATAVMNKQLYIWKLKGIWWTYDNDSDPVNWDDDNCIDQAVGCGFNGLAEVSPTVGGAQHTGITAFCDTAGAYLFNGSVIQPELTWKVEDLWQSITDISSVSAVIDIEGKRIHFFGFDSASLLYGFALVADFSEGIDAQRVKWSVWSYHINEGLLSAATGTRTNVVTILPSGKVVKLDSSQRVEFDGTAIDHFAILGGQEFSPGAISIFPFVTVRAVGNGPVYISMSGEDDQSAGTPYNREDLSPPFLESSMKKELTIGGHFMSEKCYLKFESQPAGITSPQNVGAWFNISRVIFHGDVYAEERPR